MKLRNVIVFTLSLLILFAIGCQREVDRSVTVLHSDDGVAVQPEPNTGAVFIGDAGDKFGTDEYTLNTAIIKDDTLKLNISYSGGCKIIMTLPSLLRNRFLNRSLCNSPFLSHIMQTVTPAKHIQLKTITSILRQSKPCIRRLTNRKQAQSFYVSKILRM